MYQERRHDNVVLLPEWDLQDGVMLAWPHAGTDWAYMLDQVTACYVELCRAIVEDDEQLLIVAPETDEVLQALPAELHNRITVVPTVTNDTWTRDYGPLAVRCADGSVALNDFTFNGWGMKFAADCDNQVNRHLLELGVWQLPMQCHKDLVLEGGSVESDGRGTVMTTTSCLLQANRNPWFSREQLEVELQSRLGCSKVLWLEHGSLTGDDTDGHIDTLARFAPGGVILYTGCDDPDDEHFTELQLMEQQLKTFTDAHGDHYHLIKLPMPSATFDEISRLPATYANFLVMNHQVLVPTYGDAVNDDAACRLIAQAFVGRKVVGIDCRALICQHGSLHCATMQLPAGALKKKQ